MSETFNGLIAILEDRRTAIARACQAVENCLEVNRDNLRGFFEQCFSSLLKQIFGYDGSSWLNTIAQGPQEQDTKALLELLSPAGKLLQAVANADSDDLIKFEFPLNRLPTHTQQLLRIEAGRAELRKWIQYHKQALIDKQGNCHVHLNVFEYFVFWTAIYVLRGGPAQDYPAHQNSWDYSNFAPSLGTVRKAFRVNKDRTQRHSHPYIRLLHMYLEAFLVQKKPSVTLTSQAGLQAGFRSRASDAARIARSHVLYSVLAEFWLTDGDEPLPIVQTPGAQDNALAWKSNSTGRVRSFQCPSADLLDALTVLVHYVKAGDDSLAGPKQAQSSLWLPILPCTLSSQHQTRTPGTAPPQLQAHGSLAAQAFSMRLYRFLLRAFKFWPEQQPLTPAIHLWLSFIVPWQETKHMQYGWEARVLSNVPFYSVLLLQLLDLMLVRVSMRADAALSDLIRVLQVLKDSAQLLYLLRAIDADLSRFTTHAGRRPEGSYADILPYIVDQGQRWDQFANAGHPGLQPSPVRPLSHPLLTPKQASERPPGLHFLLSQDLQELSRGLRIFGLGQGSAAAKIKDILCSAAGAAKKELASEAEKLAIEVFSIDQLPPTHQQAAEKQQLSLVHIEGLRRGKWSDLCVKGDQLRQPFSSFEIQWLVRILVHVSEAINRFYALDQPLDGSTDSHMSSMHKSLSNKLRQKGWRFNFRPIGERQTLAWLPISFLVLWGLFKGLTFVLRSLFEASGL